jgi:glucose-6-phosphate dehydrogenase assembly protein OpcA
MATIVDVPEIEQELEHIWESLESPNKTKAALFNLLVYAQDPQHVEYVRQGTARILNKYPCRVIYILENPATEEDFLRAEVSVETIGTEEQPVSCDKIQIEFGGKERERVPFVLLPHILPDLPVFLWWTGNPSPYNRLFDLLEAQIDRIIFDPDTLDNLAEYASTTLALLHHFEGYASDLNWSLIEGWRAALAQTFHNEEHVAQLQKSEMIALAYCEHEAGGPRDPRLPAVYLQAWLAAQLGWRFQEVSRHEERTRFTYRNGDQPVHITLHPQHNEALPYGTITRLETDSREHYHYAVVLESDLNYLRVERSNTTRCDLPYSLHIGSINRDRALVREIFSHGTSVHYQHALQMLAETDWSRCS